MNDYFIPIGDKTEYALDYVIYQSREATSPEDWPGIQWIMQMKDETELFREKLFDRMYMRGHTSGQGDEKAAVHFLQRCCQNHGVTCLSRQTLGSWVTKGKVAHTSNGRRNVYRLCFALNMNADETREFFLKAYLDRPFNCKDLFETVCFFCLNNHLPYPEVERLCETLASAPKKKSRTVPESTVWIESAIRTITTEQELIDFWTAESAAFGNKGVTARTEIQALLQKCYAFAEERSAYDGRKRKVRTPDALLREIYAYSARAVEKGVKEYSDQTFANSSLPELIKRNFPQRQQLQNIIDGKATDESLRKALVVLNFFAFFAEDELKMRDSFHYGKPSEEPFEDFQFNMDELLEKCGYVKMYWRNPFDLMFGYCATMDAPLEELQKIIAEYVINEEEFERTDAFHAFVAKHRK